PPGVDATSRAARRHRILTARYIEAQDPAAGQAALGLSRAQYYRELQRGVEEVVALLWERWGPGERVVDLPTPLRRAPGRTMSAAEAVPRGDRAASLPIPLTSFVGRKREVQELRALLLGPDRLVTLLGPPGVGQTRLV